MTVLTYVENVAAYFRDLTDEPDQGFMTDALAQTWLQVGFDHYYNFVTTADPERHLASHSVTLSSATTYDLNNILLGPAAPNRLLQLVRVVREDPATGRPTYYFYPVGSQEQLDAGDGTEGSVLLQGTKLVFSSPVSGACRVDYIPVPTVDWTKTAPGNNEWIDDLIVFHDMIALFAALQFYASAGQQNPQVEQLLALRRAAFKVHLQRGRSINSARYVQNEDVYTW